MTPHTISQTVLFPDLFEKPLVAAKQEQASSDGGAVLLKAAERVYGFVKAFARCLADRRAPGKIRPRVPPGGGIIVRGDLEDPARELLPSPSGVRRRSISMMYRARQSLEAASSATTTRGPRDTAVPQTFK